ncbi:uncharacterized protein FTOL_00140 [Fusarium torulosum]|uniref:GED domain-containing protein n=1 Tax=Fusarium torulosum TaxID=33205 RepID=A0AAE8SCC2_9HYPO|nr:uncharacterized protein FTOL_00140 [Fusarium torulosum]
MLYPNTIFKQNRKTNHYITSNTPIVSSTPLNKLLGDYIGVFDAVDSLQDVGLKRELIPKLVVVGDQSSGKSSVLEAICNIPFPVEEDLCTRFPIELVQRKSLVESITVTISVVERDRNADTLSRFKKELVVGDTKGLAACIQEASELIIGPTTTASSRRFSMNILRVTILGPDKYPLTLIDLPGFFQSETDSQNEKDRAIVEKIVAPYLREPRNALLLIMRAPTTWATQTAPSRVRCSSVDPDGERTLGIFTHLDNMNSSRLVMDRFSGQTKWNPRYGWHGLRNLSDEERKKGHDRDEVEKEFFKKGWPNIESSHKGIANLRPRLSEVLAKQIRLHLGDLISEVKSEAKRINAQMERLGKKRTTEQEQRDYLSKMAGDFQELCTNAVSGHYGEGMASRQLQDFFYDTEDTEQRSQDKRLQAVARALGQLFVSAMIERGKKTELEEPEPAKNANSTREPLDGLRKGASDTGNSTAEQDKVDETEPVDDDRVSGSTNRDPSPARTNRSRSVSNDRQKIIGSDCSEEFVAGSDEDESDDSTEAHASRCDSYSPFVFEKQGEAQGHSNHEFHLSAPTFLREEVLKEYNSIETPAKMTFREFETQVLAKAIRWRGTESLDDVNPAMVSHLYRDQTSRWRSIAHLHLGLVWDSVTRFIKLALKHCVDSSLLLSLEDFIINDRLDRLRLSAEAKLEELLACHGGTNPAFHDFLREFQDESLEFSNRIAPTSFYAKRTIRNQLQETLSPQVIEDILQTARESFGVVEGHGMAFVDYVMGRVKRAIAGRMSQGATPAEPSSRYLQDKERGAVRRSILMTERCYKLSLISFISYANALVIHNALLNQIPYVIFTHSIVSEQTAKTIAQIAGEKETDAKKRLDYEKKLRILKEAQSTLEGYRND